MTQINIQLNERNESTKSYKGLNKKMKLQLESELPPLPVDEQSCYSIIIDRKTIDKMIKSMNVDGESGGQTRLGRIGLDPAGRVYTMTHVVPSLVFLRTSAEVLLAEARREVRSGVEGHRSGLSLPLEERFEAAGDDAR